MSHRLEKVNELIKHELGRIILEEEDFDPGIFLTIMAVDTSTDLLHANVLISVFPDEKREMALEILNRHTFNLQQLLNKKLRMRPVPKIRFVSDQTEAEAQRLEELIKRPFS